MNTTTASVPPATHQPPDISIRAKPPSPRRLSRKVLLAIALAASAVIAFAVISGLSDNRLAQRTAEQEAVATQGGPPESVQQASAQYEAQTFGNPAPGMNELGAEAQLQPPSDPMWANNAAPAVTASGATTSTASASAPRIDPVAAARASPILFESNAAAAISDADEPATLNASLRPPSSRYAIQSGNVIPAALITGLNSDLPGRVIAQVTAAVFDSVTGDHLLIPQGSRLIGTYDNGARYGDHRILLVWDRLILPNGWSINLRQMSASDPTGASGLNDTVDNHLVGLTGAIGLSAIISVIANESEDDHETDDGSLAQNVGDAAAQQAAQTGSQIVQRELSVHPTLRIRPGANVRVLVTRDIALRPYTGARAR